MRPYRIAVIGDIHANYHALDASLEKIHKEGADELVFLGDVLSYGVDVETVIARVADVCSHPNFATLLRGNHDAMYLSATRFNMMGYEDRLPAWLCESIDYTRAKLLSVDFDALPFVDSYQVDDLYFAHANPFGADDWSYINDYKDHVMACEVLQAQGFLAGVFGHTHRAKVFSGARRNFLNIEALLNLERVGAPYVVNVGSIGQPRNNTSRTVYVLIIEKTSKVVTACLHPVVYDVRSHVEGIKCSGMKTSTISKLVSFFE